MITIRPYKQDDMEELIELWQACGLTRSQNNPEKDILRKQNVQPALFLIAEEETPGGDTGTQRIVGSVMAGYEGHRGWLNYLAVIPDMQRSGVGRQIVAAAEQGLRAMGCPKINIQIRTGNTEVQAFYRRLGFVEDKVVSMGKRLIDD